MGLLFLDAVVDRLIDLEMKKRLIILDLAFTALWTLLWFIGFCYMTNKWSIVPKSNIPGGISTNVNAALAFTFFSVLTWVRKLLQANSLLIYFKVIYLYKFYGRL